MDLSQIKSRISCEDYLSSRGILVPRSHRMVSPLRPGAKNPTSFWVQDDHYYDFGSGHGGDVIDLCAQLEYDGDLGKAIRALSDRLGLSHPYENTSAWHDAIQQLCNRAQHYHESLTEDDYKYLHDRGITDETIAAVKIGRVTDGDLKGRLFLPYFKNGYVCYYATRAMPNGRYPESKYRKAKLSESPYYDHVPWGLETLTRIAPGYTKENNLLIISEGYFDALSWYQEGYPVLSAITGRFSAAQIPTVLAACGSVSKVLIIYDNDEKSHAGQAFTQSMAELLFSHHIPFVVSTTPFGIKDVNDYYAAGHPLATLVNTATDGVAYLAKSKTTVPEIESFINRIKRYLSKSEIIDIIDQTSFSGPVKKSLAQIAGSAPSEEYIMDQILDSHRLVYVEDVGFYEWNGKIWERLSDLAICAYASQEYGRHFSTNQRKNAVMNSLKSRIRTDAVFDAKPVLTFQNGTLDIRTGAFGEPTPTDYCSIIMDYNYDPHASCPRWDEFISSVSAGVGQREAILQEIAGYVLMPTCDLQKIFILTGNGANGKTVYLNVLEALFGSANVTHVEPSGMVQDFQRIGLKNSLLNLGSDISSDFTKGEIREWLLKLSEGDTIQACYKGKNYINFSPRCKLVFACNSIPRASETAGLERRFLYVSFEMKYVESPDPTDPYQAPVNINLTHELLAELPGIFNWAYAGYRMLLATNMVLPEAPEQREFARTFLENSDPIVVFISEELDTSSQTNYDRDELWNIYQAWAVETNHHPYARNNFFKALRAALGKRITDHQRDNGSRFVTIVPQDEPQTPTVYNRLTTG